MAKGRDVLGYSKSHI